MMRVEETIKETVLTHSASKARAKAKEIVTLADRPGIARESAHTCPRSAHACQKARAKAKDCKESVTSAVRRVILQESARRAKKEESQKGKETVTKEKAKDRGVGERKFGR